MESLTGGGNGKTSPSARGRAERVPLEGTVLGARSPNDNAWVFITVFLIAVVMFLLASNLVRSRPGGPRSHVDNEIGRSRRVNSSGQVMAFAINAWTAVGGGCFALAGSTIALTASACSDRSS
jgi:hypothetical protein